MDMLLLLLRHLAVFHRVLTLFFDLLLLVLQPLLLLRRELALLDALLDAMLLVALALLDVRAQHGRRAQQEEASGHHENGALHVDLPSLPERLHVGTGQSTGQRACRRRTARFQRRAARRSHRSSAWRVSAIRASRPRSAAAPTAALCAEIG